jgi:NAD(P)-dependent dehydrogenase (short-subunit alcohol dehydrogenase family)|tara:strand:- start:896 stop:1303 length:408 start_codon:yes stop_codon:yes gene_type:complete
MMATNVRAPFLLSQLLLPGMMERKQGSIVNITSRVSEREIHRVFAYSTSKAALNRLTLNTEAFAKEANVAVNALCPGRIKSDDDRKLNPGAAVASDVDQEPTESVAPPVVWLAGQDASFTGNIVYREEFGKSWGV